MKNTGSEFFDEAYFVVADAYMDKDESDMIREANRIIDEAGGHRPKKSVKMPSLAASFSFAAGSLLTALTVLLYRALA